MPTFMFDVIAKDGSHEVESVTAANRKEAETIAKAKYGNSVNLNPVLSQAGVAPLSNISDSARPVQTLKRDLSE